MGRFGRSWELVKQSFAILKSDKQLMLLPVASAISCLLATGLLLSGVGGTFFLIIWFTRWESSERLNYLLLYTGVFVFYLVNYFVIVFFNAALVSAASERLAGRPATLRGGVAKAWERRGKVAQWALLSATVGVILKMVENRLGLVGRLVIRLIGTAWTLASYFVVPVLVFEDLGPVDALKRSARVFRDTWGEDVISGLSVALIFILLIVAGVGGWFAMIAVAGAKGVMIGAVLLFLYCLALTVANSTLQGILIAALYQYATTGMVPPGFTPENFSMAWEPKKKKFW
jgi:hypothetical protein